MRHARTWLLAIALAIAGCTVVPKNPAQAVYLAHGNYAAGLVILQQYKALPTCAPSVPQPCKDEAKLKELLAADEDAFKALSSAQAIVRGNLTSAAANQAARDAEAAIAKFRAQTATVKVTP
jgi:hypothetical protein